MSGFLIRLATLLPLLSVAAAHDLAEPLVTPPAPPALPRPLPQGAPAVIEGALPAELITLDYAIVDGQRVLFDQATGRIVYVLYP
jgi:hypothetical protein